MSLALTGKKKEEAELFYAEAIKLLTKSNLPFMLGGTYAYIAYTGITRPTKDLDIFCLPVDYPKILKLFEQAGYQTELYDTRWCVKVYDKKYFIDIIFSHASGHPVITHEWLEHGQTATVFGETVKIIAPEEFIWTKSFIQEKTGYGGVDINHIILFKGKTIDWHRLLSSMDPHWEILLGHLLNFRFVYPSEREIVPKWLMEELIHRVQEQFELPTPKRKICRGRILSPTGYLYDVTKGGFDDLT